MKYLSECDLEKRNINTNIRLSRACPFVFAPSPPRGVKSGRMRKSRPETLSASFPRRRVPSLIRYSRCIEGSFQSGEMNNFQTHRQLLDYDTTRILPRTTLKRRSNSVFHREFAFATEHVFESFLSFFLCWSFLRRAFDLQNSREDGQVAVFG